MFPGRVSGLWGAFLVGLLSIEEQVGEPPMNEPRSSIYSLVTY